MQAGWYSDPVGNHELRYHNGTNWTGDVATDGVRHVTEVPVLSSSGLPPRSDPRSGTVAMVFGIISMTIGVIPVVCFIAMFFGGVGVVLGLRRRRFESARGTASVGIVTGSVGILLSAIGVWLTVVLAQAVADFEDPGPHEVELIDCSEVQGATRATGEITNLDDRERSYTIVVSLDENASVEALVSDVPAGELRTFQVDEDLRFAELDCSITDVFGPRLLGLEP